jgi:hypothetical protein
MYEWEIAARTIHEQRLRDAENRRLVRSVSKASPNHRSWMQIILAGFGAQLCTLGSVLQRRYGEVEMNSQPRPTNNGAVL